MTRSDDYARDNGLSEVDREVDLEAEVMALAPPPAPTCDWGHCDMPAVAFRSFGFNWLPVCEVHKGITPVYACLVCCAVPCICHLDEDARDRLVQDALARLLVKKP